MQRLRQQRNEIRYCLSYRIFRFLSRSLALTGSNKMPYAMGKKTFRKYLISLIFLFIFVFICVQNSFKCHVCVCMGISSRKPFGIEGFLSCVESGLKPQEWHVWGHRNDIGSTSGHLESVLSIHHDVSPNLLPLLIMPQPPGMSFPWTLLIILACILCIAYRSSQSYKCKICISSLGLP